MGNNCFIVNACGLMSRVFLKGLTYMYMYCEEE